MKNVEYAAICWSQSEKTQSAVYEPLKGASHAYNRQCNMRAGKNPTQINGMSCKKLCSFMHIQILDLQRTITEYRGNAIQEHQRQMRNAKQKQPRRATRIETSRRNKRDRHLCIKSSQ